MVMSEAKISAIPVYYCEIVPSERSQDLVALTSLCARIFWTRKPCPRLQFKDRINSQQGVRPEI